MMANTIGCFKGKLKSSLEHFDSIKEKLSQNYPTKIDEYELKSSARAIKQREKFTVRRENKFTRDGLDLQKARDLSLSLLQPLISREEPPTPVDIEKNKILDGVVIPPYDPINLDAKERDLPPGLPALCKRGPSFVPLPESYDYLQLQKDYDRFRNSMRAEVFFSKKEPQAKVQTSELDPPKPKSKWKPPRCSIPEVETFLNKVEKDLFSNTKRKRVKDNITVEERTALNLWRKDHLLNTESDLVMRQQDKGNRFIIVDKETDLKKANEQIERSSFRELNIDPTIDHIEKVKQWTEKWLRKKEIDKNWKEFILNDEAQPGKNTPLYKTHKANTPVRVLTTGCNTAIENLSRFLEVHSAPLTTHLQSRIKDTAHLLELIGEINSIGVPTGTILVSFDVVNMFPNIDNERGLATLRSAYDKRTIQKPSTQCLIEALWICLYCNNSTFNNKHLLQTNGTATGAPNSCSYSDLAVQPIDDAVYEERDANFAELKFYGRYRDDCFVLWTGSEARLHEFHSFINTLDNDLKFTVEIGGDSITFLDLKIDIVDSQLVTTVYSKPTDSHLYLQADSCHQETSIKGIQKGVALRLRRICSSLEEFDLKAREYSAYLVARGHNPFAVQNAFNTAREKTIPQAREKVRRSVTNSKKKIFITKYNPLGPNVRGIIKKHMHILEQSSEAKNVFPNGIMVAAKREKNLKELLTRADPYSIKSDLTEDLSGRGFKRCNRTTCDVCDCFIMETNKITSTATGKSYLIRRDFNCNSPFVIYCAICTKCRQQGVGSTFEIKPRVRNYKYHIKEQLRTCGIVKHFLDECVDDGDPCGHLLFVIIDGLNNTDGLSTLEIDDLLLQKEKFWIGTLLTQHAGMNCSHDWNRSRRNEKKSRCNSLPN